MSMQWEVRGRRARSLRGVEALSTEVEAWLGQRRAADPAQRHHSQLDALSALLTGAASALAQKADGLPDQGERGAVFRACAELDQRTDWLRRVFVSYAERFDQRDDPLLGPVLAAADEVVWSCYRPVYGAEPNLAQRPAPLPFFEPEHAPRALPSDLVPRDLQRGGGELLQKYLEMLPIPLIGLPRAAVAEPWWLIFAAHEVGHHVQYALGKDRGMVGAFAKALKGKVTDDGDAAADWFDWGKEVFADLFSVASVGPWAVWALVELELTEPGAMGMPRGSVYPPAAVRLALCQAAWQALSGGDDDPGDPGDPLRAIDPAALARLPRVKADLGRAATIAQAVTERLPDGHESFEELAGFEPETFDDEHAKAAMALDGLIATTDMRFLWAPRRLIAASTAAWAKLAAEA
ncbi:MAG: hypothetical protein KC620_08715, partial [Myxococcales bacterium]|nr:hypothetical protein [Myxococcales bacterium]